MSWDAGGDGGGYGLFFFFVPKESEGSMDDTDKKKQYG